MLNSSIENLKERGVMKLGGYGVAPATSGSAFPNPTSTAYNNNKSPASFLIGGPDHNTLPPHPFSVPSPFCVVDELCLPLSSSSPSSAPQPTPHLLRNDRAYANSAGLSLALTHGLVDATAPDPCRTTICSEPPDLRHPSKIKDDGYESRSGSDNLEGVSGDEQDPDLQQARPSKKRYHRHAPAVIQELEAFFKECPHPDEKQRQDLSRRLNLASRQVKFWFQNRRTQLKAQQERHDNNVLRQENERLRAENFTIREAMRNASCPTCGGPTAIEMSIEEQQIRFENARMRDELERLYAVGGRAYGGAGKPLALLPPSLPYHLHHPPLLGEAQAVVGSAAGIFSSSAAAAAHDFILSSCSPGHHVDRQNLLTALERSMITELAVVAMEEFVKVVQAGDPLWVLSLETGRETLDFIEYLHQFPRGIGPKPEGYRSEASRDVAVVMLDAQAVVESFLDVNKWIEAFPGMICKGDVGEAISLGSPVSRNGALQLMYAELQVPTPLLPTRQLYFLRYCKMMGDGIWAVVDVSVDNLRGDSPSVVNRYRRRPSGCLVQQLSNGCSKVTWMEHSEFDDRAYHHLYRPLVLSGMAFGAQRWLSTLKRHCERLAIMMAASLSSRAPAAGVVGIPDEASSKMGLLKMAQRMTAQLCSSLSASSTWTTLSGNNNNNGGSEEEVRVMTREYNSLITPSAANPSSSSSSSSSSGVVLSASTSVWLPAVSPQRVFHFLTTSRSEWDVLSVNGPMEELLNISTGHEPGNYVSLLKPTKSSGSTLIFQECCSDSSGSSLVYAPVDLHDMDAAMNGMSSDDPPHPNFFVTVPSGFIVMPDGLPSCPSSDHAASEATTNKTGIISSGSLVTVAFQIHVNSLPKSKLTLESINTVNTLVCNTVSNIKKALLLQSGGSSSSREVMLLHSAAPSS